MQKRFKNSRYFICLSVISLLFMTGCSWNLKANNQVILSHNRVEKLDHLTTDSEVVDHDEKDLNAPEYSYVTLAAVGDVMMHMPQIRGHYIQETGKHDFSPNFKYISPLLEDSDISIANLETTFAGYAAGYSGFPRFNAPDDLAHDLKNAGFNVISTINNHTYDTGESGFFRTLEILENEKLIPIGTRKNIENKPYYIEEVNDIVVALTAFSYETPSFNKQITLNGIVVPNSISPLMNTFNDANLEASLSQMEHMIKDMKADGAEVIVFYMHWGNEYQTRASSNQKRLADELCKLGVDLILGSHPHVVQPVEVVSYNDHETLVVYSMGNFVSNQREETLKDYIQNPEYTEDGLMVKVTFEKNLETNEVKRKEMDFIPLWVHRYRESGGFKYNVLPVNEVLSDIDAYPFINEQILGRLKRSLERTEGIVGKIDDNHGEIDNERDEEDLFEEEIQEILNEVLSLYDIDKEWFGFYIKEHESGQVFSYNNELIVEPQIGWEMGKFNAASAVKLPLSYIAVKHIEAEGRSLDDLIYDELTGNYFSPRKMISETLIHSTNYSYNYLLRYIGRDQANEYLEDMGVVNSKIISELGGGDSYWSLERMRKEYGSTVNSRFTPEDYGLVINKLYEEYLAEDPGAIFIMESMKNNIHRQRIPQGIKNQYPVAHKTGTFTNAGRFVDMGLVLNPENPYTLVLILDGQKNHQQCDPFLRKLSQDINDYMNLR